MKSPSIAKSKLLDVVKSSFGLLAKSDRKKLLGIGAVQILLNFLDLLGIALVGLVASLAVTGINSKVSSGLVETFLKAVGLESQSLQTQTAVLATLALASFIIRTLLSMYFIRRTLIFLGRRAAEISADLFGKILARTFTEIGKYSHQQYVYFLTAGVETLVVRIVGTTLTLAADISLLIFILTALFLVDLSMTIVATIIVGAMTWLLHRLTVSRAKELGTAHSNLDISSRESLIDALAAFKEITTKDRGFHYEMEFRGSRTRASRALAEYNFMPYMGKYVIESSIMFSAFLIAGAQFLLTDALSAITTLSLFMAAGSRLAPAVLRIQQGFVRITNSWGIAGSTLALMREVRTTTILNREKISSSYSGEVFIPRIELRDVAFRYPGSNTQTLVTTNLVVSPGESIALVGPSGSGKTTLVDLMTGILAPDSGTITLSGVSPRVAIAKWPEAVGYVPQEVYISSASVAENVALGYSDSEFKDADIWEALKKAQISDFISTLKEGLSTSLGDRGVNLSGGQKQRLGIARALLTRPKLLFLDEATSALDSQTEHDVSRAISALKGHVTLICIAHRLSTARRADRVIYLDAGKVRADGTFDEVLSAVPDFHRQAKLMELP